MKICSKCQIPQPLGNFSKGKNKKDGKSPKCKLCEKQYREENKERIALQKKQWQEENKKELSLKSKQYREENKDVIALRKKKWQQENKERLSLKHKNWREENKDRISQRDKQYRNEKGKELLLKKREYYENNKSNNILKRRHYYENNKEQIIFKVNQWYKTPIGKLSAKNSSHKRRTVTKQGDVTTIQLKELLDNSTHCFYCNNPLVPNEIHVDHYIPLHQGGLHTISNLRITCRKCNLQKGKKMPEEFLKYAGKNELGHAFFCTDQQTAINCPYGTGYHPSHYVHYVRFSPVLKMDEMLKLN